MILIDQKGHILFRYQGPQGEQFAVHIYGWVVGVRRQDRSLHALDAGQVTERVKAPSRRRTYDAACGARVRVMPYRADGLRCTALWPPRVSTLAEGVTRCSDCWEQTGRRRPSHYFPAKATA